LADAAFFVLLFFPLMMAARLDKSYSTGPDDFELANMLLTLGPELLSSSLPPFFRFLEDALPSSFAVVLLPPAPKFTPSSWMKSAQALDVLGEANGKPPALAELFDGVDGVSPLLASFSPRIPRPSHVICDLESTRFVVFPDIARHTQISNDNKPK
jgi:hypothetical protein